MKLLTNKLAGKLTNNALLEILSVGLLMFIAYLVVINNINPAEKFNNSDVHRGFQRGISISQSVNPYLEFNPKLMLDQEKVPGFFPLYFYLMFILAHISNYSFVTFLDTLRVFVFLSYVGLGLTIYLLIRSRGKLPAFIVTAIFMFNRWTVEDVIDLKQDTYVLLALILSLAFLKRKPALSFFLYGVATAVKHITIFAFPVYLFELIYLVKNYKEKLARSVLLAALMVIPIIGPAIPFFINTPHNFINALLYNGTRVPEASGTDKNSGLNKLLVLYNQDRFQSPIYYAMPRIPLIFVVLALTIVYALRKLDRWQYCAFVYIAFVAFNPVLYGQYFTWAFAFIPFLFPRKSIDQ